LSNSFREVLRNGSAENIPVWFMRQAGRYMPSYREVRKRYSMLELCKNYETAAEVSYLPVKEIGVDAAIVFSDILLILENMGYSIDYPGNGSPVVTKNQIQSNEKFISHGAETIKKFRENHGDFPIIGFTGAPLTILSYAVNGKADPELKATRMAISTGEASLLHIMNDLKELLIHDIQDQIKAGAEAIQIFDSWLGFLPYSFIKNHYLKILQEISAEIHSLNSHLIFFSTGTNHIWEMLKEINPDVISIDWRMDIFQAQNFFGRETTIQGNLDPVIAATDSETSLRETGRILGNLLWKDHYIFNLGHGVLPETDQRTLRNIVKEVHNWKI